MRLIERVDAGLDDQVSIGWSCAGADCSECGEPIYSCRHIPGDIYAKGLCEFEFSGLIRVVEDSFVFQGGQKNTTNFIPDGERGADAAAVATAVNRFLDSVSGEMAWIWPAVPVGLRRRGLLTCLAPLDGSSGRYFERSIIGRMSSRHLSLAISISGRPQIAVSPYSNK